jgi:uncharacterized protein DUF4339
LASNDWYYARDGRTVGPVSAARLKELAASGVVTPADLVRPAGTDVWVPARAVKGLFPVPVARPATAAEVASAPAEGGFVSRPQARQPAYELIIALAAVVVIGVWYALAARGGAPRPGSLLGHSLGVLGLLMMLCTETLYSLRKRLRGFHFGRMRTWLQVHIFTGIVGPFLVLLHSAGKFNGLAGVLTLLTLLIVLSGFVGRYLYTAVPRTLDGVEVEVRELDERIAAADRQLQALGIALPEVQALAAAAAPRRRGWMLVLGRHWLRWRQWRRLRRALQEAHLAGASRTARLRALLAERYRLQLQIDSLAVGRRLMALWHVIHIPLGVALFTLAFLHVGGALYYSTLLK